MPAESAPNLRRLRANGSVRLDGGRKLADPDQCHPLSSGDVIRVGKRRWFQLVFAS